MALLVFQRSFPSVPFGAPLTTKNGFSLFSYEPQTRKFRNATQLSSKKEQFENEGNFPRGRKTEILPPFPCVGAEMEGWEKRRWRRSLGIANLFARTSVHRNGNGIPPHPLHSSTPPTTQECRRQGKETTVPSLAKYTVLNLSGREKVWLFHARNIGYFLLAWGRSGILKGDRPRLSPPLDFLMTGREINCLLSSPRVW